MAAGRNAQFLKDLRAHQFLDAGQLDELERSPLARGDDLQALARHILQKGWLTRDQVGLVAQGRAAVLRQVAAKAQAAKAGQTQAGHAKTVPGSPAPAQPVGPRKRAKGLIVALAAACVALLGLATWLTILNLRDAAVPVIQRDTPVPVIQRDEPTERPSAGGFSLEPIGPITLRGGELRILTVQVVRKGTGREPIEVRLQGLPETVVGANRVIEPGKDSVQIRLSAPRSVAAAEAQVQVIATHGETEATTAFKLTLQQRQSSGQPPPVPVRGGEIRLIQVPAGPVNLVFQSAGPRAIVFEQGRRIQFDMEGGKDVWDMYTAVFQHSNMPVAYAPGIMPARAVAPDNSSYFLSFDNGTAASWIFKPTDNHRTFKLSWSAGALAISADKRYGLIADGSRSVQMGGATAAKAFYEVRVFDLRTGSIVSTYRSNGAIAEAAISPDNRMVFTVQVFGQAILSDLATGKEIARLTNLDGQIRAGLFAPDSRYLFTAGSSPVIRMWDTGTSKPVKEFVGQGQNVIAVSADGRQLLSGGGSQDGNDFAIRLWEIATGKELKRLEGHTRPVKAVAFSPDGRQALSWGADLTVRLWDLPAPPP